MKSFRLAAISPSCEFRVRAEDNAMAIDASPIQSLRRHQPSNWLPSYSMTLENPSSIPLLPSPRGHSRGGAGEGPFIAERSTTVFSQEGCTNSFAWLYHSTPFWKAWISASLGRASRGPNEGRTTGSNPPRRTGAVGWSHPRIQVQTIPHDFTGS